MMTRVGRRPAPFRAGGEGLLESAVMRPQMAEHYEGADVVRQATLLAVAISQAQAFLDGNQRTAFIAADTFLRIDGHTSPSDSLEYARQLEAVATRADSIEAATDRFEAWL